MLIFIDDSGDPGFKLEKGASKFFVICCVIFDDHLQAEKISTKIKELKRELNFSENTEFKFNKSRYDTRISFLKAIKPYIFRIRVLSVNKKKIKSSLLKNDKQSFYSYFIKMVLRYNRGSIIDAKIKIDGSGDRVFKKRFVTYLKKELNSKQKTLVNNLRLVDSKSNQLIQMADMIAGTIRRYKEGDKQDAASYYNIIKNKIEDCWDFK